MIARHAMDLFHNTLTISPTLGDIWFPTDGSASNQVDGLAYFILWVCGFFLVFNAGLMVFFAIRYRQKKKEGASHGQTHNTALELTWSILPAFILAIIFIWGFRGFLHQVTPPANAYDIMVTGYKWGWDFTYPNGLNARSESDADGKALKAGLHVPAGRAVRLTLQSNDVIHSVFLPQMRVKQDVVPGRFNQMWFEAKFDEATAVEVSLPTVDGGSVKVKRNEYDLFCTEYCGQDHSRMITKLYVYTAEGFEYWYQSMALIEPGTPLIKLGQTIYETQCASCHKIDGSNTANYPSWLNLYGATNHATSAGPVTVDDTYIIESIRNPGAKLAGKPGGGNYGNQMAAFPKLSDRELRGVIEFMKSISDEGKKVLNPDLTYSDLNLDGTVKEKAEGAAEGGAIEGAGQPQTEPQPEAQPAPAAQ